MVAVSHIAGPTIPKLLDILDAGLGHGNLDT
jgi:hypothetical protein